MGGVFQNANRHGILLWSSMVYFLLCSIYSFLIGCTKKIKIHHCIWKNNLKYILIVLYFYKFKFISAILLRYKYKTYSILKILCVQFIIFFIYRHKRIVILYHYHLWLVMLEICSNSAIFFQTKGNFSMILEKCMTSVYESFYVIWQRIQATHPDFKNFDISTKISNNPNNC